MRLTTLPIAALVLLSPWAYADADAAKQALQLLREGNHEGARQACQVQAEAGDAHCQEAIGRLLLDSKYPARDPKKGMALLRQAADAGLASAQLSVGFEHLQGINAQPNAELALRYTDKAAQAGNPVARANLGNLYRDGRLVTRDLAKARGLYASSTTEISRVSYAEMAFFGEGGPREVELASTIATELIKSANPATARRAQVLLDTAKRLSHADKYDVALYLNPFSSELRRTLEGQWVLRDSASRGPLEICWPDGSRSHIVEANALLPGYEQRMLTRLRKLINEAGISSMPANLVRDAGCARRAPLLIATRAVHPQLPTALPLSQSNDQRQAQQMGRVDLIELVAQTNLESRDRFARQFNQAFSEKADKWALAEAASSGQPIIVALQIGTGTGQLGVCALKTDAAAARVLAQQSDFWSTRRPALSPHSDSIREFDSAEALFDAITAKADACPLVLAQADTANRLSTALGRDKIAHRVFVNSAWTADEISEIDARAQGFANAQQMAFAKELKATPEDLKQLAAAGITRSEHLAPIRKRASAVAYPGNLATAEGLVLFVEDESAGKKVKKTATQIARERAVAAEAARKKAEAAEQLARRQEEAARKKAEAIATEQKKRDERDSNAERLSELAGIAGATMCRTAADSYVASVAKYAHRWDDVGFFGVLFDKYLVKVETPGVLTMTSSHLLLQNGFGAFKRVRVFCDYDTRSKKVRDVRILDQ